VDKPEALPCPPGWQRAVKTKDEDRVAVAFWDRQAGLTEVDIRIPTGGNARAQRLRTACAEFALDHACYMWAMPDLSPVPTPGKPWLGLQDIRGRNVRSSSIAHAQQGRGRNVDGPSWSKAPEKMPDSAGHLHDPGRAAGP
jgi:hypothetical protein